MNPSSDPIHALREALQVSPDNIPLRQHIADLLLSRGEPEAAEKEYVLALALAPHQLSLKFGLARAFYQQQKDSQALVVVEELLKSSAPETAWLTLHAQILLRTGNIELAVQQFRLSGN
jgi:transitional endoplasmic reticulum ATPase